MDWPEVHLNKFIPSLHEEANDYELDYDIESHIFIRKYNNHKYYLYKEIDGIIT